MDLGKIMTKNIVSVDKSAPIEEAAKMMKEHDIGFIPVCEKERVVGVITDRDIVLRDVAKGGQAGKSTCGEVMTSEVVTGTVDMDVHKAAKIMAEKQIRRIPVVEDGKLVGVVALGDLAVEPILVDDAGEALNDISKPSQPMM